MSTARKVRNTLETANEIVQSKEFEQFRINAQDFMTSQEIGNAGTQISQITTSLSDAAEALNRSFAKQERGRQYNVISPVVTPKDSRSYLWIGVVLVLGVLMLLAWGLQTQIPFLSGAGDITMALFGPHYWLILGIYVAFQIWKNSFVMIPDGCQALITRFGKLEAVVDAGRVRLISPWKKVSYIVNTTKEYPYNAPIREAPTESRVNASVDLFLQFRIVDPAEFIFTLGGSNGFSEKLQNAISEVTRALIYGQKAEDIYDLVGENIQSLLDTLNKQFLPAVRFVNANITDANPSSQEYRIDLAAPEIVRVAKGAYTYQYELQLRKEQDEGELNKELGSLFEQRSNIRAEIATHQARIDTAREKEINRANAYARQITIEAESEARANTALLEAQALDIRALSSAYYPEILQYRFEQDVLDKLEAVAERLPRVISIGQGEEKQVNFMKIAQGLLGAQADELFTSEDLRKIQTRVDAIMERIRERNAEIENLGDTPKSFEAAALSEDDLQGESA